MKERIIKNGLLFDGTGRESFSADILIREGRIALIGDPGSLSVPEGADVTDLEGSAVLPSFLQIAGDEDVCYPSFQCGSSQELMRGGVGAVACFLDGRSPFPRSVPQLSALRSRQLSSGERESWQAGTLKKWMRLSESSVCALPLLPFTGYDSVRDGVLGPLTRPAWPDEIRLMEYLVQQSFEQGSWGLSASLRAEGCLPASKEEFSAIAKLCYVWDRTLALMIPSEAVSDERIAALLDAAGSSRARILFRRGTDPACRDRILSVCPDALFEEDLVSLEGKSLSRAISDRTKGLCDALGIRRRGSILPGMAADLAVCPADRVSALLSGEEAVGMRMAGGEWIRREEPRIRAGQDAFLLRSDPS